MGACTLTQVGRWRGRQGGNHNEVVREDDVCQVCVEVTKFDEYIT